MTFKVEADQQVTLTMARDDLELLVGALGYAAGVAPGMNAPDHLAVAWRELAGRIVQASIVKMPGKP